MRKVLWAATVLLVSVAMAAGCMSVQSNGNARSVTCTACDGTGQSQTADPATGLAGKCPTCDGTGKVPGRRSGW